MDLRRALAEGAALPYSLIFTYGGVTLGRTPEQLPPEEEVIEARFFSEEREIHVWREGGTLRAACLADSPEDAGAAAEKYKLENGQLGAWIAVRRYWDYDEDGQCYVSARRLAGWEGGNAHG